jgi:hypothetical protein
MNNGRLHMACQLCSDFQWSAGEGERAEALNRYCRERYLPYRSRRNIDHRHRPKNAAWAGSLRASVLLNHRQQSIHTNRCTKV